MVANMNHTGPIVSPDLAAILADVDRRGITLQVQDGKLRYRPRSAVTPDLAERLKAQKPALLTLLARPVADRTEPADEVVGGGHAESGVLSVVSMSEVGKAGETLWSEDELAMLARAGISPADLPLVTAVKSIFADLGATVVSVEPEYGRGGWTRRRAAELIRRARRRSTAEAVALRTAWMERMGICTNDGGLTEDQAERIALSEIEGIVYFKDSTGYDRIDARL